MSSVELIVTVIDDKNVQFRRETGGEKSGSITQNQLNKDSVEVLVRWLNRGQLEKPQEFKVLGTHLYHLLFDGSVRTFFENALDEAKAKGERLSLQLSFQQQTLSTMPWEYLYCPETETERGYFLATDVNLAISRFLPLGSISLDRQTGKLKILLVISQPSGPSIIVAKPVNDALSKLSEVHPIEIDTLETPTVDNFQNRLGTFKPHIVHFMGHGQLDEDGEGQIALLGRDEQTAAWCNFYTVAEYFRSVTPLPRLVFLHMNEGASQTFTSTLKKLASDLLRSDVQAVLAMQCPILNNVAIRFCRKFYPALAAGEFIDSAVQAGRIEMIRTDPDRYTNRMFGGPVLYMRNRANIIQGTHGGTGPAGNQPMGSETPALPQDLDAARKRRYIMAAAQEEINKANLLEEQQKSMQERISTVRQKLANTSDPEWAETLLEAWDIEPDAKTKSILFTMYTKAKELG
jgi:hypothetical protein